MGILVQQFSMLVAMTIAGSFFILAGLVILASPAVRSIPTADKWLAHSEAVAAVSSSAESAGAEGSAEETSD
ncbi:MAG: hypothetical protein ACTHW1_07335 [Ancrocorticia sp.]|uniref:hypothetical protein n=1 Tax=Ancrocorticia sp. TaxID=2593684 RepID=UPI003F9302B9